MKNSSYKALSFSKEHETMIIKVSGCQISMKQITSKTKIYFKTLQNVPWLLLYCMLAIENRLTAHTIILGFL